VQDGPVIAFIIGTLKTVQLTTAKLVAGQPKGPKEAGGDFSTKSAKKHRGGSQTMMAACNCMGALRHGCECQSVFGKNEADRESSYRKHNSANQKPCPVRYMLTNYSKTTWLQGGRGGVPVPVWAGKPPLGTVLHVMKEGKLIDSIPLLAAMTVFGRYVTPPPLTFYHMPFSILLPPPPHFGETLWRSRTLRCDYAIGFVA